MTLLTLERPHEAANPLDLAEEIALAHDWPSERTGHDELVVEVTGRWCGFHLVLAWDDETRSLYLSCAFDMRVPPEQRAPVYELLALVNDRMWIGHFDLTAREGLPSYRHSLLLRGSRGASAEQVEDLVDIAVAEVERFYPTFQLVIWGGRTPADAIAAAMLDTAGEA